MGKSKGRRGRVVALCEAANELVLAQPRLVELSPEQERESVRLLADLFAQAARRRDTRRGYARREVAQTRASRRFGQRELRR